MNFWIFIVAELIWITVTCEAQVKNVDTIPVTCAIREKTADCSYKTGKGGGGGRLLETFPVNVVQQKSILQSLDISATLYKGANITQLTHLTRLVARELETTDTIFAFLLNNIPKLGMLEELDLSGTHKSTPGDLEIDWPTKITKLFLSRMMLKNVKRLTRLDHLQELDLSSNQLTGLPKLSNDAPMTLINLLDNEIANLTVEEIASFCELTSLRMDNKGLFTSTTNYHQCATLEKWATDYHISTDSLQCSKPTSGVIPKNLTFSAQAIKARQDCLAALPSTSVFELLLYAVFFSILFPVLYFGNEAYQRYQSNKLATPPTPVKRHRRRTTTAAPSEIDLETAHSDDGEPEENEG